MENEMEAAEMNNIHSTSNLEINMDPYSNMSSLTENSTENELQ